VTVQWWELTIIASVCTFAGWMGASRRVVWRQTPPLLSEIPPPPALRNGQPFECDGCHGRGFLRDLTITLTCSACGHLQVRA
jgi:hypothetical protein